MQTGTVLLSPADTFINLNATNYSTSTTLATYTWPHFQPANAILMKFNLSSVPPGAVVQSAQLKLALVESDQRNGDIYTITAHKIIGLNPNIDSATGFMSSGSAAWAPSNCCYNGIPLAQSNISPAYASVAVSKTIGWKSWTITNMVQEWLADPSTNFGVLLNSDAAVRQNRYRYFASMEYPDVTLRPALEVTFTASDATPPTVSVTSPINGTTLSNTVSLTASAQDAEGIAGVQFRLNGSPIGQEIAGAPYTMNWNTSTVPDGTYSLTAVARDNSGNTATSSGVGVTVRNGAIVLVPADTFLTLDANNNSASQTLWTYTWPEYRVANAIVLKFDLSALPPGASVQDATLSLALTESDATTDATYTISAHKIINRNTVVSAATGYTYDGSNPWSGSACCYEGVPLAQSDITSAYDQRAIDKAPGFKTWSLTRMVQEWVADPSSNYGVLLNSDATKYKDRYRAFASTEHATSSLRPSLTVRLSGSGTSGGGTSGGDTSAPSVSIASPSAGAILAGSSVTVTANATDNIGVVGVQFKLDGSNIGGEDFTAPYSTSWNTTSVANGAHTLTAVARDAAGNYRTSASVSVNVLNAAPAPSSSGISALYPGDVGIENHPNVIFTEQFEEGAIASIIPRWGDAKNPEGMRLSTDVPPGTPGGHSLSLPMIGGGVSDGGHLYKVLSPGINDTLYVRYYIKYPTSGILGHSGIWMGGFNPISAWPDPQAGSKPNGDDRFIAGAEQNQITQAFDHYNYWVAMHPDGHGSYWGDFLLNNPSVKAPAGQWVCVEEMVKLNNPTTAYNGEHAIWLNGVKVSHLGQGFPNGYWNGGIFTQDPSGTPFEGFRWRTSSALNLNWIWLQNYSPDNPAGYNGTILYDHVVAATSYIGCVQ